jgi:hypothetical protein
MSQKNDHHRNLAQMCMQHAGSTIMGNHEELTYTMFPHISLIQ